MPQHERGLSSKAERLSYKQDTVEHYHQSLPFFQMSNSFKSRTPDRHSGDVGAVPAFGTTQHQSTRRLQRSRCASTVPG